MDYAEFQRIKKAERRAHRDAIRTFVQGARTGDLELFCSGLELVEEHCVFQEAFRAGAMHSAIVRLKALPRRACTIASPSSEAR